MKEHCNELSKCVLILKYLNINLHSLCSQYRFFFFLRRYLHGIVGLVKNSHTQNAQNVFGMKGLAYNLGI